MNSRQHILDQAKVVQPSKQAEVQTLVQYTLDRASYQRLEAQFPTRNPADATDATRLYGQQQVLAWVRSNLVSD